MELIISLFLTYHNMNKTKIILQLFDELVTTGNALYKKYRNWKQVHEDERRQAIRLEIKRVKAF